MNILLLNPYFEGPKPDAPQFGLYYLATYLQKNKYLNIKIIDPLIDNVSHDEVLKLIPNIDYLCLTAFTDIRFQCFTFAKKVKSINPNCKIILGGVHATALYSEIMKEYDFIDIIIRGEGEESLLQIIKGDNLKQISNISYREKSMVVHNFNHQPNHDLNNFNLNYDLLPDYFIHDWKDYEVPHDLLKLKHLPIIASRGCPYACNFCSSNSHWKSYRVTSAIEVVNRMEYLVNKYGIEYFRFYDALFPTNTNWIQTFCNEIKKRNLNIKFRIDIRSRTNYTNLKLLKEVGCVIVGMGVESASNKILNRCNKKTTFNEIVQTIDIVKNLDYWIIGYFMIGLPSETKETIEKTISLIEKFDYHNYTRFQIYPNTQFAKELIFNNDIWFDESKDVSLIIKRGQDYFSTIRPTSYCKENFPHASFYHDELTWPIQKSFYQHNIRNTKSVFKKYGIKGILILINSTLDLLLKGKLKRIRGF